MFDVEGLDYLELMEWLCVVKIGGDVNIGKGIYIYFFDDEGNVCVDLIIFCMVDCCCIVDGVDVGLCDYYYVKRIVEDKGFDVMVIDVSEVYIIIGIWGLNVCENLKKVVFDLDVLNFENFLFVVIWQFEMVGK